MKNKLSQLMFLLFLATVSTQFSGLLYQQAISRFLTRADLNGAAFRTMQLSDGILPELQELSRETGMPLGEILTTWLPFEKFHFTSGTRLRSGQDLIRWKQLLLKNNREGFQRVAAAYGTIWDDLACFPVAESGITYENTWMFERTYGGTRGHEGTDLMPEENIPGHYRVVSMTDGTVENIGWLPRGGYRIGIRSPSGGYFYYAHLDSYSQSFRPGQKIEAGEILGRMGDSGYGEEGTRGKFDVHLHLGIYIATEEHAELSVNPYWVLRYLEKKGAEE